MIVLHVLIFTHALMKGIKAFLETYYTYLEVMEHLTLN